MRWISDATLARAVRSGIAPLRRAAARKAAARALHAPALAGGGGDPAVLATLGLWEAALAVPARDAAGRAGQAVAKAALGQGARDSSARLSPTWQRRLVAALAPADPIAAAALLPAGSLSATACRYAADPAHAAVPADAMGAEAMLLRAGVALATGEDAVTAFNAVFAAFDLSPPAGEAVAIDRLAGDPGPPVSGPLVSVVMPLHQGEATVGWAVRSLLRQGWRDLEVIVVDDRSSDRGPAIVRALAEEDPRVRQITSDRPAGVAHARNAGIAAAQGEWIGFLDADDWAHPQRIARQMARIGSGVATVSTHFRMDAAGRPVAPRVFPLIRLCPISMVARRAALEAGGGFLPARTGADAELLARLDWLHGRRAVPRDPAPLTVASWRPHSLSSDAENGMLAAERARFRERWMRDHAARWLAGEGLP